MSIKLSIVVPIYNSKKYLPECLESICVQIKKNVELILIDDSSRDTSVKICRAYIRRFKFIKLIRLKKNKGVSYSRNVGINNALGRYLCFVDSDDKLLKGSVNNMLNNIDSFNGKDLFVLRYIILSDQKISKQSVIRNQINQSSTNKSIISSIKNLNKFALTCWNFVVKKDFLHLNKIYFKNDIKLNEDTIFVPEILCMAKSYKIISKPSYGYRIFDQDTLGKSKGFVFIASRIKVICELCEFISKKKNNLNREKIKFLFIILGRIIDEVFFSIIICKPNDIKKAGKHLQKYKDVIMEISNYGFKKINFLLIKNNNINTNLISFCGKKSKNLKKITKKFKKNKLIIFCAGYYGRTIYKYFTDNNFKINAIIDNNTRYTGNKIDKIAIESPLYLKNNFNKFLNNKILICNKKIEVFNKIKLQLNRIGFKDKNIFHFNKL